MKHDKKRRIEDDLTPIRSEVKDKPFAVFDLESKAGPDTEAPGFTDPFMVGFFDGETYTTFFSDPDVDWLEPGGCVDRFCRWLFFGSERAPDARQLCDDYADTDLYAHNGGNFDFLFLLPWLADYCDRFEFSIIPVQTSIQILEIRSIPKRKKEKVKVWRFLDSLRLLPLGLDKAAKTFGLDGKMVFDLRTPRAETEAWIAYNKVDCVKLYEAIKRLRAIVTDTLKGEVGVTLPATAMRVYRRAYLGHDGTPTRIPRHRHFTDCQDKEGCEGCLHPFVRLAYYGGRTEIFETYGEDLHYYDRNSSYPAAMLEWMPAGMKAEDHGKIDPRMMGSFIGFVECTVSIPEDCYLPPLPYRLAGKLVFPAGRFSGVWSTTELALLDHPRVQGTIERVGRVVWFEKKKIFDRFVTDLYAYRDKSRPDWDEGISLIAKLILNSGYGKFGMNEERTEVIYLTGAEPPPEGAVPAGGDPDARVWYKPKNVSPAYVIPQIAAEITTHARVALWHQMIACLDAGGKIFYCDTDSVITSATLPSTTELGGWKDEYPGETLRGEFIQPKVYILSKVTPFDKDAISSREASVIADGELHHKVAMKGLPGDVRAEAYKMIRGMQQDVVLVYPRLEKFRSMARRDFGDGPRMVEVKKGIRSQYTKRIKQADGSTTPLVIREPEDAAIAAE